jgi:hypothetical protein
MIPKRVNISSASASEYKYLDKTSHRLGVTRARYIEISKEFFRLLAKELITSGEAIILPSTMGALQAVKYRRKDGYNAIDNKLTAIYDKKIYHQNLSTDGYWCRIHWYRKPIRNRKYGARFKYAMHYKFSLTRPNYRVNTYNKVNPEVNLVDFFLDKGWEIYAHKQS